MRCEFKEGCTGWLNHALLDSCHFDDLETVLPRLPRPRFLSAGRRREFDSRHRGPSRDIQIYLADAEKFGLKIRHGPSAISMRTSWPATWSCAIIHLGAWICATQSSMPRPTSRGPREWASGRIEGSLNLPLNHLQERIGEISSDRLITVHCAGGYRSSIAASILQRIYQSSRGPRNLIWQMNGHATD